MDSDEESDFSGIESGLLADVKTLLDSSFLCTI